MQEVAFGISRDFIWRAHNQELDEWIGSVRIYNDVSRVLSVGLRIISETGGFGSNYEDIAVFGLVPT